MVVIRLQRVGKPKQAHYRLVAIEKTRGAAGKPLEILGSYNPRQEKRADKVVFNPERYAWWLGHGAKPSPTVATLVRGRVAAPAAAPKP